MRYSGSDRTSQEVREIVERGGRTVPGSLVV
jgi:hypothetical protein